MMAARVAGVPMPSASVRIFLTAGSRTNFATPHMAAMSDASLKGFGGAVRLPVTVTSTAVTASPRRSAGKGAVDSFSFSAAAVSPSAESSSVSGAESAFQPRARTCLPLAVKLSPATSSRARVWRNSCGGVELRQVPAANELVDDALGGSQLPLRAAAG